jgi:hypothetical protein
MKSIFKSLIIGTIAGIIDTTPMILMNSDFYACLSAFLHWVVLGVIIPYVIWNIKPWLKGGIIGIISALPIIAMIFGKEPQSALPILLFSAVLGILVGIVGSRFVEKTNK